MRINIEYIGQHRLLVAASAEQQPFEPRRLPPASGDGPPTAKLLHLPPKGRPSQHEVGGRSQGALQRLTSRRVFDPHFRELNETKLRNLS